MDYLGKIDKRTIEKMNRKFSRQTDIEEGRKPYGHKVHKTAKDFKRNSNKKPVHQYLNDMDDDF